MCNDQKFKGLRLAEQDRVSLGYAYEHNIKPSLSLQKILIARPFWS